MTKEQRAKNRKLVPRRNQDRKIAFVEIKRDGERPKVKAIRAGHAHHYQQAFWWADVSLVKDADGKVVTIKRHK